MTLYLDASAWLKLFLGELGGDAVAAAVSEADTLASCRHAQAEVLGALRREGASDAVVADFDLLWSATDVLEIDGALCEAAALLAARHSLGTLDALHLASAVALGDATTLATWDRRLWDAAHVAGLETVPRRRP